MQRCLSSSCSNFFDRQKRDASCVVIDPPSESGENDLFVDPVTAWRVAYAKAFRFVGLDSASQQVFHGEPATTLVSMYGEHPSAEERENLRQRRAGMARERFGADLLLDVGPCALGIDSHVLAILHGSGINRESEEMLEELTDSRRSLQRQFGQSFLNYLGIGCIFYDDLEPP